MSSSDTLRPRRAIQMTVNGRVVKTEIEPRELLLDFLRDRLNLTGAKRSCDMQVCGACTVLVDGVPVSACCTLAYEARDKTVLTIEGLSKGGALHPLQRAFINQIGVQCGFCTSGMILSAMHLLKENPRPTRDEIRHFLKGNLCRCTGYTSILESIEAVLLEPAHEG